MDDYLTRFLAYHAWSLGLVVLGLVLLVLFALGTLRVLKRTRAVQRGAVQHFRGQVGHLTGRWSAIRAEAAQRRRDRAAG